MQLVVGRIGRAHGIRGDVAVDVRTDDPQTRFAPGAALDTDPAERGPLTVSGARWHAGRLLVRFAGVDDRTAAEALAGVLLVVDSASSPPTDDPDEFWDHDLTGLAVVTVRGEPLGRLTEIVHGPGGDLLVVQRDEGGEVLVPFVKAMVPEVDVRGGRVVVDLPDGLLDL